MTKAKTAKRKKTLARGIEDMRRRLTNSFVHEFMPIAISEFTNCGLDFDPSHLGKLTAPRSKIVPLDGLKLKDLMNIASLHPEAIIEKELGDFRIVAPEAPFTNREEDKQELIVLFIDYMKRCDKKKA